MKRRRSSFRYGGGTDGEKKKPDKGVTDMKKESLKPYPAPLGALKLRPAAQYLGGLSVPTMHRLINRGLLKANKATRHLLFSIEELDRFLRET